MKVLDEQNTDNDLLKNEFVHLMKQLVAQIYSKIKEIDDAIVQNMSFQFKRLNKTLTLKICILN